MVDGVAGFDRLMAFDRDHVWHPYSSAGSAAASYLVESAAGVRLSLRMPGGAAVEAIDAMSSWWCAIHGYAVPALDDAVRAQLSRMSHVMFGGLTHEPAIALAERLVALTPAALQRVFFADSGSVSVEVAMKMALQFQVGAGGGAGRRGGVEDGAGARRTRFFTIRGGYHGDTFSPMSVTDPVGGMHSLFTGILPEHVFAPFPPAGIDVAADDPAMLAWERETRELFAAHAHEVAAVILEPVLQGAGGMRFHSPHVVQVLAELAREHGALVIFDEIATGFGRTGTLFAMERAGVVPDIVCVGKALTGGYVTLAAVLCTDEVAIGVSAERAGGALMHGPTFMANPLACAVALASLDLLQDNDFGAQVRGLEAGLTSGLKPAADLPAVADVRVLGGVGVIQLREPARVAELTAAALECGVWIRPFRDLVYTMPPYVTSAEDLATVCDAMVQSVATVHG